MGGLALRRRRARVCADGEDGSWVEQASRPAGSRAAAAVLLSRLKMRHNGGEGRGAQQQQQMAADPTAL